MGTRSLAALCALLISVTISACGGTNSDSSADQSAPAASGEWPRTIDHAMGSTTIPEQPKRIVALDQSLVDGTILLETEVVGFTEYRSMTDAMPEYLGEPAEEFGGDAKTVGTLADPSLEAIAALQPDLIVSLKVRHEALYDKLSAIAPTVFGETSADQWKSNLGLLGKALGEEDLAAEKIAAYESAAKTVGDAINAKAENLTVSVVRFLDGPTRLYSVTSYSGLVLADAGINRPASATAPDGSIMVELSEENVGIADAGVIFVTSYGTDGADSKARFEQNPLWQALEPKTVDVDDTTWMTAVSLQGAMHILRDLADHFGVEKPELIS